MRTLLRRAAVAAFGAVAATLAWAPAALAHNFVMDLYAFFGEIDGQIYFSDGTIPQGVPIQVFAPDGTMVTELTPAADGTFAYTPETLGTYRFYANAEAGHEATRELEVTTADFPTLAAGGTPAPADTAAPPGGDTTATPAAAAPAATSPAAATTAAVAAPAAAGVTLAEVQTAISQGVRPLGQQIIALQQTINQTSVKAKTHEILGGIGYIIGIAGVAFFLVGYYRLKNAGLPVFAPPANAGRPGTGTARGAAPLGHAGTSREAAE